MGEQLHFSMDGEFLTAIARDWFWNMDKPYKKCEELLLSCMMGGNEEEKRHVCQDIIEGRKKLVGVNEFELVDDNVHVRSLGQKVEELQPKMLVNQIREDMIAHPLNYVDRFAMTDSYETLCTNAKHHYIDCSYDGIKCFLYGKTGYSDAFNNGAWLFTHPDLVAEFNGEPLPEQESNPEFYKTDFWTKLASWIEANMKGTSVERRQRLYNSYISDRPIQHQLTEYGLIAPDGTWYACEFGEHAALAGRIIMRNTPASNADSNDVAWLSASKDTATQVTAEVDSFYTLTVPEEITLSGTDGTGIKAGTISVTLTGDIPLKGTVQVKTTATPLQAKGSVDVPMTIATPKVEWNRTEMLGDGTSSDYSVSAVLAPGDWTGTVTFECLVQ